VQLNVASFFIRRCWPASSRLKNPRQFENDIAFRSVLMAPKIAANDLRKVIYGNVALKNQLFGSDPKLRTPPFHSGSTTRVNFWKTSSKLDCQFALDAPPRAQVMTSKLRMLVRCDLIRSRAPSENVIRYETSVICAVTQIYVIHIMSFMQLHLSCNDDSSVTERNACDKQCTDFVPSDSAATTTTTTTSGRTRQ
jgi:hypothetical protein